MAPSIGRTLWRAYLPIVVILLAYVSAGVVLLDGLDAQVPSELLRMYGNLRFVLPPLLLALICYAYVLLLRRTEPGMVAVIFHWFQHTPFLEVLALRFLPAMVLLAPLQSTYLAFKRTIPEFAPFSWDGAFAALDRAIFIGADPWTLTHWLFPTATATYFISAAYTLWLHVLLVCFAAAAVLPLQSRLRMTFLLTYFISWAVAGTGLAILFSSAGPVYVERLYGDSTFSPLMQLLWEQRESAPILTLLSQEKLWQGYTDPSFPAVGISAFPSMHLCMATVVALFGFGLGRPLGWALTAFAGLILIGSVHLGWHYAVDGIAGIALGVFFWAVSARFAEWWLARTDGKHGPEADGETMAQTG